MEKPRLADPASLGDGRGGEVLEVRQGTHAPQPPSPQRYAVRLVEGSSEAFMRALIERHPGLSLRLRANCAMARSCSRWSGATTSTRSRHAGPWRNCPKACREGRRG